MLGMSQTPIVSGGDAAGQLAHVFVEGAGLDQDRVANPVRKADFLDGGLPVGDGQGLDSAQRCKAVVDSLAKSIAEGGWLPPMTVRGSGAVRSSIGITSPR
jgi:hypothetical protein